MSKTQAGICCAFSWQNPENMMTAISSSGHPRRQPLIFVNYDEIKYSNSLGEIWISSGERLFPEPQIRMLHKPLQSPAWSWNERQWIKPNNFQPLVLIYISYYITKKLQTFNLSLYHRARQCLESGGITAVVTFNSTNSIGTPIKG